MSYRWFYFVHVLLALGEGTYTDKEINCGSHFTSQSGSFSSPGYPGRYPADLYCVWTVSANGKNPEIYLKFSQLNLPNPKNGECPDFVAIYSGFAVDDRRPLSEYCSSSMIPSVFIMADSVRVVFVSNADNLTSTGFQLSFRATASVSSISTSQATAGIVAAIFCGIVFLGVGAMRCIMMGACHRCQHQRQPAQQREGVGTNESLSNFVMDCPPSYVTVMEHPECYPTPTISPHVTPTASPRSSRNIDHLVENYISEEPPPSYVTAVGEATDIDLGVQATQVNDSQQAATNEQHRGHHNHSIETVIVHNSPSEERSDTHSTGGEPNRNAVNRQDSYNIASCNDLIVDQEEDGRGLHLDNAIDSRGSSTANNIRGSHDSESPCQPGHQSEPHSTNGNETNNDSRNQPGQTVTAAPDKPSSTGHVEVWL